MIISKQIEADENAFMSLLSSGIASIQSKATKNPKYFCDQSSSDFEKVVYDHLVISSKNTQFEGSIELFAKFRFPDIVINRYYGVEVKTTKKNHWQSTGNSVLETTRIEDVERIYMFFGILVPPPKFRFRKYEECLYDVAVTHSPRYLINMELNQGDTIFDRMGIKYDELRKMKDPIKEFVRYFRKIAKNGEAPWWMDRGDELETIVSPMVTLWNNMSEEKKNHFRNEALARFPEVFGNSSKKYQALASWLVARHGIVNPSLRDPFTAGGKISILIGGKEYKEIPKIFEHLNKNMKSIIKIVSNLTVDDVVHYWNIESDVRNKDLIDKWVSLVISNSNKSLPKKEHFIVHLLSEAFKDMGSPPSLIKAMNKYGLRY